MEATTKFEVGETYEVRSLCDWDCKWAFTVTSRTDKFVTLIEETDPKPVRVGVKVVGGVEWAKPFGSFSMAPSIHADRKEA